MTDLSLQPIASNDFLIFEDTYPVGRITLASALDEEIWNWNCTLPVSGAPSGTASGLEDGMTMFRRSWTTFKTDLGSIQLAEALEKTLAEPG